MNEGTRNFLQWLLTECDYRSPREISPGRYGCIARIGYCIALLTGQIGNRTGYEDRWDYGSERDAKLALDAWDGTEEPQGWLRNPKTGRRRPDGDQNREFVNL